MKLMAIGLVAVASFPVAGFAMDDGILHLRGAMEKKPVQQIIASYDDENHDFHPYIGETVTVRAKFEDTLLGLAREHNIGFVAIVAANPGVDPFLPGVDREIIIPKRHVIPKVPREGIVINLAEMRMYSFIEDPQIPKTYPIGIGRDGLNTPLGVTKITRKKDGPTWYPTSRMREEKPELPASVPPGEDNPLGTHALYLGWPSYIIHGTNKPFGVGRRVSSGCIRMYPEDIIKVFDHVPVGTQVRVIKEPVKLAWIDDMLYLEAHAEDELADSYEEFGRIKEYKVPSTLFSDLEREAGDQKDRLDWNTIREALKKRSGIPVAILLTAHNSGENTQRAIKKDQKSKEPASQTAPVPSRSRWNFNS